MTHQDNPASKPGAGFERRPTLREIRPLRSLCRRNLGPVDKSSSSPVDEREVGAGMMRQPSSADLFGPMNRDLSQYITIHRRAYSIYKIRKNCDFICVDIYYRRYPKIH